MTFSMIAASGPLFGFLGLVVIYCMPRLPVIRPDGSVYQPLMAHIYTRRFVKRGVLIGLLYGLIAAVLTMFVNAIIG
jgi:hypothetical protein